MSYIQPRYEEPQTKESGNGVPGRGNSIGKGWKARKSTGLVPLEEWRWAWGGSGREKRSRR